MSACGRPEGPSPVTLRIADTFTDAMTRLTGEEQAAVRQAAFDLQVNPADPGLPLHRVDRARARDFWTMRADHAHDEHA